MKRNRLDGRGERIRTSDPLLPKQVRYQAALRPDCGDKLSVYESVHVMQQRGMLRAVRLTNLFSLTEVWRKSRHDESRVHSFLPHSSRDKSLFPRDIVFLA